MATAPQLLHVFATFAPGGPQVRAARLIEALGGEFRHAIVAMDGVTTAAALLAPALEVRVLECPARAGALASVRALRRLLAHENPNLLLTYNWGAIEALAAARTRGPARRIHHEDGFRHDEAGAQKARRVWARRLLLAGADVIVPSRNLERVALDSWHLRPARVHCIPNGIRVGLYSTRDGNPELRARLRIPNEALVIGSVAHLRGEKNLARLLESVALLPERDVHVLLVGDGPERSGLERLAEAGGLHGRMHFAGHQTELGPWYRAMDVFALSSDTEQMPVALLEAMASALPVVSTDVGDVRAMLPDEQAGFVTPLAGEATATALAGSLDRLARDTCLRERLGLLNRERVRERYGFETMLAAHRRRWLAALAE